MGKLKDYVMKGELPIIGPNGLKGGYLETSGGEKYCIVGIELGGIKSPNKVQLVTRKFNSPKNKRTTKRDLVSCFDDVFHPFLEGFEER